MNYARLTRDTLATACTELADRDRTLRTLLARNGLPPMWTRRPGYATLVQLILEQQVSLDSARATYARLQRTARTVTPAALLALDATALRQIGFSRQKARYVHALSRQIEDGELNLRTLARTSAEEARGTLLSILGVGPWTADVYLLMALRHPDVWPPGDVALEQAFAEHKTPRSERGRERILNRWRPWRSVAARVLWHDYLAQRGRL